MFHVIVDDRYILVPVAKRAKSSVIVKAITDAINMDAECPLIAYLNDGTIFIENQPWKHIELKGEPIEFKCLKESEYDPGFHEKKGRRRGQRSDPFSHNRRK